MRDRLGFFAGRVLVASLATAVGGCTANGENLFGAGSTGTSASSSGVGGAGGAGGAGGTGGDMTSTSSPSSSSSMSSSSASASSSSASASSSTGATCGDGICNEDPASCPGDCPVNPCEHGVCTAGNALVVGCDPCVDMVCAQDDYCCNMNWDDNCVSEADQICGSGCCGDGQCSGESCQSCPVDCGTCPVDPTCPHSQCFVSNTPLDTTLCHDACAATVCQQHPECCGGPNFSGTCQGYAFALCPGGDPCITAVCAQTPECCTVAWSQTCVDQTTLLCNTQCNCPHSICAQGDAMAASCNPCVASLCTVDDYCCMNGWDGLCIQEVEDICGIACN